MICKYEIVTDAVSFIVDACGGRAADSDQGKQEVIIKISLNVRFYISFIKQLVKKSKRYLGYHEIIAYNSKQEYNYSK